jgi:phosphate transport system permease protein
MTLSRQKLALRDVRRKLVDRLMKVVLILLCFVAVLPLFSVFLYVIQKGIPGLNASFFTELPKPVGETGGGLANALLGSLVLVGLGSLLGIPWGLAAGIYLSEYSRGRISILLRFAVDLLTSVPSIIVGLFAYAVIVVPMKSFSAYAGGFALAVIMVPMVARSTEEILKLVPDHVREAGLALGLPRWRVTLQIILRGCRGALMTGIMLSLARVAGETAPILFTAFSNRYWARSLAQPTASLPVQIYTYAISPFEDWHQQAWTGALVLVMFVLFTNLVVRYLLMRPGVRR